MVDIRNKIVRLSKFDADRASVKALECVLCFGHFNVIHPGHLRYFDRAKTHGEKLVVAVEGDHLIADSERNQMYSEIERAESVAAIEIVDLVIVLDSGTLDDLIFALRPILLVLGNEFKSTYQERVKEAVRNLDDFGGKVLYETGDIHYATSSLVQTNKVDIEKDRWRQFSLTLDNQGINLAELTDKVLHSKSPKILVIGDTIIDRYVACDPVGMSNEAPVIVVKEIESKDFLGGAAIVSAHVSALGAKCEFISVVGEDDVANTVRDQLARYNVQSHIFEDATRPTTFKLRYMVENQKLFRVSRLKEHSLELVLEEKICATVDKLAPSLDGIIVSDFVYGVISNNVFEHVTKVAEKYNIPLFGDLQCSSQVGSVLKFKNFCLISPTEREARIALSNQEDGIERVANLIIEKTNVNNLILKLGADGFIAYADDSDKDYTKREYYPALTVNPVDVTGAGDSLLAVTAVMMANGYGLMEAAAIANCVAAITVQTVGNIPIKLTNITSMLSEKEGYPQ